MKSLPNLYGKHDATFTPSEREEIQDAIDNFKEISDQLCDKLFDHFCNNNEMPYGVAKARTGDPYVWINEHMHEVLDGQVEEF